ncbi:restriction endonuclease subunit S [Mycoplasmopsis verecunda]|uniref:Type I restriction modification DNA specificity domain-containing protein n=1 Tax=Mycoplasmopsis verecunda TaxID=171291 RepID=A0A1T4M7Y0_9BACT|nr:restriction endonuclease subunit S [Mycoplasmopsis verecunda]WPB54372.1 restriction endonuclease subunit S [Mycoplasmopsis verecunda]SJZ63140.1 Type I restriction modification DNA specificity domain-containing protein [Mycoplasmopsis verecunda]
MSKLINENNLNYFKLSDIFEIKKTKNINSDDLENGNIPYITRTALNNGVSKFVDSEGYEKYNGNCIIIGGESALAFYQSNSFLTGNNITMLRNDKHLNRNIGLYIVTILNKENFRYSYGRAWNKTNIDNTKIKLPSKIEKNKIVPDWDFMNNYINNLYDRERER